MRAVAVTCSLLACVALVVACKRPSAVAPTDAGSGLAATVAADVSCRSNAACGAGQYCEYAPGLCGKGKKEGTCRPKPEACAEIMAPVCGCDGRTYANECAARAVGVDLSVTGGCKEPIADWAPCGPRYCDVHTSYCAIYLSDVFDLPTDHFCRPLPPDCLPGDGAVRTCACFPKDTACLAFCGPLPTAPGAMTGFHLTCQGKHPPAE